VQRETLRDSLEGSEISKVPTMQGQIKQIREMQSQQWVDFLTDQAEQLGKETGDE